jgi:hypothetical protein
MQGVSTASIRRRGKDPARSALDRRDNRKRGCWVQVGGTKAQRVTSMRHRPGCRWIDCAYWGWYPLPFMQGEPMKQLFRRGVAKAGDYAKARPEAFWSIIGTTTGATAGLFVGGVGIAAGGGATGVSWLVVLLILSAHNAELPELLLKRLRNPQTFEGAVYEARVIGSLARAGFHIELEDETDSDRSHCELRQRIRTQVASSRWRPRRSRS